jgi:hypothetical protein
VANVQITTEVAPDDEGMPDLSTASRTGQWTEAVKAAAEDGKVRKTSGIPEGKTMEGVRRQLSHTAGALKTERYPNGAGIVSRVKDGVLYWQVAEKRVRSSASGTSTPDGAGGSPAGDGGPASGATPGGKGAKAA